MHICEEEVTIADMKSTGMKNTGLKKTGMKNTSIKNTGIKNTGMKNTGIKNTSIKNTGMKNKNRNGTGPKWISILLPLLLTGCLIFPGVFPAFPEGPFLPDSFLSVSAAVYAAEPAAGGADPEEGSPAQAALSDRDRMLPDGEKPDDDLRVGDGDPALPAWYPKDPLSFPFYHDEKAPRVIDIADIFSGEIQTDQGLRAFFVAPGLPRVFRENVDRFGAVWYDTHGVCRPLLKAPLSQNPPGRNRADGRSESRRGESSGSRQG